MVATLGHRVTIGKSGIHGWGAFAKKRHAAREWCYTAVATGEQSRIGDLGGIFGGTSKAFSSARLHSSWAHHAHLLDPCCRDLSIADTMVIEYVGELVRESVVTEVRWGPA